MQRYRVRWGRDHVRVSRTWLCAVGSAARRGGKTISSGSPCVLGSIAPACTWGPTWSMPGARVKRRPVAIDLRALREGLREAPGERAVWRAVLMAQRLVPSESGAVLLVDRGYLRFNAATDARGKSW